MKCQLIRKDRRLFFILRKVSTARSAFKRFALGVAKVIATKGIAKRLLEVLDKKMTLIAAAPAVPSEPAAAAPTCRHVVPAMAAVAVARASIQEARQAAIDAGTITLKDLAGDVQALPPSAHPGLSTSATSASSTPSPNMDTDSDSDGCSTASWTSTERRIALLGPKNCPSWILSERTRVTWAMPSLPSTVPLNQHMPVLPFDS